MTADLEIIYKIYDQHLHNVKKRRKTLKVLCLRDIFFSGDLENEGIKKLKTEYWRFSAYYIGVARKKENFRPKYEDILDLERRTEKYLKHVNNIRQRFWFWIKPELK